MTDEELIIKVNTLLDEQQAADRFSGAVLVARQDRPILAADKRRSADHLRWRSRTTIHQH